MTPRGRMASAALVAIGAAVCAPAPLYAGNCTSVPNCYGGPPWVLLFLLALGLLALAAMGAGALALLPEILEAAESAEAIEGVFAGAETAEDEAINEELFRDLVARAETINQEAIDAGELAFRDGERLADHALGHAGEFGVDTAEDYLREAQRFFQQFDGLENNDLARGLWRWADGTDTGFYDAAKNAFGVLSDDGVIRTFFSPTYGLQGIIDQVAGITLF